MKSYSSKKVSLALAIAMIAVLCLAGAALAQTYTCTVTVHEDWSWDQHCVPVATPAPTGVPTEAPSETPTVLPTESETPTAAPTETPTIPVPPTATPTATATMDHGGHDEALYWHAPAAHLVNGVQATVHEHGDAPPEWVLAYNRTSGIGEAGTGRPAYEHVAGTPNENGHDAGAWWKHTAFKGWAGRFQNVDWYGIFHLDFNPSGHPSRFHSYQMWLRDATGAVSYMHGWLDFGVGNSTGPQLMLSCGTPLGSSPRPVVFVNRHASDCPNGQRTAAVQYENWYAQAGRNGIDFGWNINSNYYAGGNPADWTSWRAIGGVKNLNRRIEFAYYGGTPRGEFWTDQFGLSMSGQNDPICGTQITVGERTYTRVCLRQYVAPSLPNITFPGNSVQRQFTGSGTVQLPN